MWWQNVGSSKGNRQAFMPFNQPDAIRLLRWRTPSLLPMSASTSLVRPRAPRFAAQNRRRVSLPKPHRDRVLVA